MQNQITKTIKKLIGILLSISFFIFTDFAYADFNQTKKSGIFSSGGFDFTIGKKKQSTDARNTQTTHTGSMVGNLKKGSTNIVAGEQYTQSGSTVNSLGGDVNIAAKQIDVQSVTNTASQDTVHKFKQSGLTVSLSVPVVDVVTGLASSAKTMGKSKNSRVNAMAAANTALQGYEAGQAIQGFAKNPKSGVSLSVSLGSQKSKSESHIKSGEVQASHIQAAGEANLIATGGDNSNINIIGSDIAGAKGTNLYADNDIRLMAGSATNSERSSNKSSGGSIGLKISSMGEFGVSLSANKGKGYGNGDGTTYRNSHVGSAASKTTLNTGEKLTLKGAQILGKAAKVTAKDLDIESLQNSSSYKGKQKNMGGSLTVGLTGVSGSANYGKSKINADHQAVAEQSGILAGDEGFQVNIQNHTDLKGGIITSTQKAQNDGTNSFKTGTIATDNLQNHSEYDAKGFAISGGIDLKGGWSGNTVDKQGKSTTGVSKSIGYGKDGDSQSNITSSGIGTDNIVITDKSNPLSAEQVKTSKTTEQVLTDNGLQNRFDKDKVQSEIDLQVSVTQSFDKNRQKLKKHFSEKLDELKKSGASQETIDNWQTASLLVDGVTGALYTPNANGLLGDAAQIASPHIANQIGDYFTGDKKDSAAHGVAHAVLAAAVAAAGGNDALTAGLSAGSAELAAPLVSKYLYGDTKTSELTAEQKQTVSNITSLIGTTAGATTGNVTDAVASGRASENAVDNNWGKEGHYSTVVAVMYLGGLPPKLAEAIGLAAWAPDTDGRNAITAGNVVGGMVADYGPQVDVHALQDKDAEWFKTERKRVSDKLIPQIKDLIENQNNPKYVAEKLKSPQLQNDLHYLGDLYAHTKEDGSGFSSGWGHVGTKYGGHQPDMPNTHQNAYRDYVRALHNVVSQATGQQGNAVAINRIAEDIPKQELIIEKIESHQRGVKRTRYEVDHAKNQAKIINNIQNIANDTGQGININTPVGDCELYLPCVPTGWRVNSQIDKVLDNE